MAGLCLTACQKELVRLQSSSEKKISSQSFIKYNIFKGKQYCDRNIYVPLNVNQLAFKVKFDSSAIYKTQKPENQGDINKLFGFSDNNTMHHDFSARFGWRWSNDSLRLFAYVYNRGVMTYKELGIVEIGKENNCSITVSGDQYLFELNGVETKMPRASTTPKAEGYQLYPYFGGDEPAPHDISIWIENL
ncbi:MAG TPA: hypothetical protein VFT78_03645 [Hanamia sp.]|nr:hypothetical protein [Hanamia sp.]